VTNVGMDPAGVFSSVVQADTYVFEPGDGDRYLVTARVLFDDEARHYNASPGAVMLQVEYERRWLALPLEPAGELAFSYVAEKAHLQGFVKGGMQRHVLAFHHLACGVVERESLFNPMTLSQMGWDHSRFAQTVAALKQDVASIRRDAEVA
jgi:hypothetical protein